MEEKLFLEKVDRRDRRPLSVLACLAVSLELKIWTDWRDILRLGDSITLLTD